MASRRRGKRILHIEAEAAKRQRLDDERDNEIGRLSLLSINYVDAPTSSLQHAAFSSSSRAMAIGQASFQIKKKNKHIEYVDFGDKVHKCHVCGALFWRHESLKQKRKADPLIYSLCCQKGKILLAHPGPTPPFLAALLDPTNGHSSLLFRKFIRAYNSMFAFTSMGARIEHAINNGSAPYVFKISGQVYHLMGSILPPEGACPKFAQLYVHDTQNEVANRLNAVSTDPDNSNLEPTIIEGLISMLDNENVLVKSFRYVREQYAGVSLPTLKMRLLNHEPGSYKQYELPSCDEIACLIVGDIGLADSNKDIIIHTQGDELKRVSKLHPKYMSLQYPLLFPFGDDGYSTALMMNLHASTSDVPAKRKRISMRSFYAFQLQDRLTVDDTLFKGGRLFQQYLVDAYATVEENRLDYIRKNQDDLVSHVFQGIYDAISKGEHHGHNIGQKVILPSSFTGSPRHMINNYQDAMAICRQYGNPDLFITFTCNVKWPEITREFAKMPGYRPEDRPDLVTRVFKTKFDDLLAYIKSGKPFGEVEADVSTIEFQKRGLPHSHMLIWLKHRNKCFTSADIDSIISAEIPNQMEDPKLYDIVSQCMVHGPCGHVNYKAPCMKNNKCSKSFPKPYRSSTTFDSNVAPQYKRPDDDSRFVIKNGIHLDNRYVIPYNRELLLRYNAHINVESCSQSMLIKYLFKYITKGPNRARMIFEENLNNEVNTYLNCRYIASHEAVWRLFQYPIHVRHPTVERLPVHLPLQNNVTFRTWQSLRSIVNDDAYYKTMLTGWFMANSAYPDAIKLKYSEFLSQYIWSSKNKCWKPRKRKSAAIGRLAYVHPASGELYYLRLLLNEQKGCIDFESIRTVNGVLHPTYQDACRSLKLLGDDTEWDEALKEASQTETGLQMRQLFVTMLLFCDIGNPKQLYDAHWLNMCDDIVYKIRSECGNSELIVPVDEQRNTLLYELEKLLHISSSSLKDFQLPMPNIEQMIGLRNRLLREELSYNRDELKETHARLVQQLNECQKTVYSHIVKVVSEKKPGIFFVYGHGGTGKTFLWHTLISKLRSEGKIVLAVASSGIASLLLPGGRTAHSRFKIPLAVTDCSICSIKKGTDLAILIQKTDLIVWDEAPMNHRHCFEALDKCLRDLLSVGNPEAKNIPFGGKPFLLGGDFRQILPVIPDGSKADVIDASINSSYLWQHVQMFYLTENMRLNQPNVSVAEKRQIQRFATWILKIGDGCLREMSGEKEDDDESLIEIPSDLIVTTSSNPIKSIFTATYPDFKNQYNNFDYLRERAIVTPRNSTVDALNAFAINSLPGTTSTYLSHDTIEACSPNSRNLHELYPPEFINKLEFSGMPSHTLVLKIGMPVMLLRNLNQASGLCNGTRLVITKLFERIVEAKILTGSNIGDKCFLPRIVLKTSDNKWPFDLKRRQFPIKPCYAMTINKSQGQSLKQVGLYLPEPVFTHGQLYVAVSRVTNRKGLKILINNNEDMTIGCTKNIVFKDVLNAL